MTTRAHLLQRELDTEDGHCRALADQLRRIERLADTIRDELAAHEAIRRELTAELKELPAYERI